MFLRKTELKFKPSTSPDVTDHKLYVSPDGKGFSRDFGGGVIDADGNPCLQIPLGIGHLATVDAEGYTVVDLSTFADLNGLDGTYDLALVSVDNYGNESAFFVMPSQELDFTVPEPVLDAFIVRS